MAQVINVADNQVGQENISERRDERTGPLAAIRGQCVLNAISVDPWRQGSDPCR